MDWYRPDGLRPISTAERLPNRPTADAIGAACVGKHLAGISGEKHLLERYTIRWREHREFPDGSTLIGPWRTDGDADV